MATKRTPPRQVTITIPLPAPFALALLVAAGIAIGAFGADALHGRAAAPAARTAAPPPAVAQDWPADQPVADPIETPAEPAPADPPVLLAAVSRPAPVTKMFLCPLAGSGVVTMPCPGPPGCGILGGRTQIACRLCDEACAPPPAPVVHPTPKPRPTAVAVAKPKAAHPARTADRDDHPKAHPTRHHARCGSHHAVERCPRGGDR